MWSRFSAMIDNTGRRSWDSSVKTSSERPYRVFWPLCQGAPKNAPSRSRRNTVWTLTRSGTMWLGGPIGVTALQNERLALEANLGVRAAKYVPPLSNRPFCVLGARTALDLHKKRMNKNIGQFTDNPVPHHSVPQGVSHTVRTISFLATGSISLDSEQSKSPASLVTQGMA